MRLDKLIKRLGGDIIKLATKDLEHEFAEISFDSRDIKSNSIFFAFRGETYDSHEDALKAFKDGRVRLVIAERDMGAGVSHIVVKDGRAALSKAMSLFFNDPILKYKSVAVTGTNGKTTTSYILDSIFKSAGASTVRIGTTGAQVGNEFIETNNTTPSAYEVFSILDKGLKKGCSYLSIEVSSHALQQGRLAGIKFDAAIFTNLTGDHLDFHKNMENYFEAKKILFSDEMSEKKVVNIGFDYGKKLAKSIKGGLVTFAADEAADIYPVKYSSSVDGIIADVSIFGKITTIRSNLIGKHNLENILGALSAAYSIGVGLDKCVEGIEALKNVAGRLEKFSKNGINVFVDYAHTDDALKNVILALKSVAKGKVITLFGAGGDRDKTKRPRMAKVASELSDVVIITSDNPRTEDPEAIIEDIKSGIIKNETNETFVEIDREKAIALAIKKAKKDDVVLVAGKGHEDYQIIGKVKHPFDDRLVVQKYL